MLKNYLKIAFRNIRRNKLYSFINIFGLAVGMAACILILLWVTNETSYNHFNKNIDRIFLVAQTQHYQTIGDFTVEPTPLPLERALKNDYPEVEYSTRYEHYFGKHVLGRDNRFFGEKIDFADSSFFKMFTFRFAVGDPTTALTAPNSIVLTKEMAAKYFGDENPIGRQLTMDGRFDLKVTGVIDDVPENSDLQFDGIVPTDVLLKEYGFDGSAWNNNLITTFVMLRTPQQASGLAGKISGLLKKHDNDPTTGSLFLFPFKDYHLYSLTGKGGRIESVILFSIVALIILVIASINFMNLATARSARRITEVGVKKVLGGTRAQIARQFFGESIVVALFSLCLALVIVEIFIPYFNEITGETLSLFQVSITTYLSILGLTILTGVLAGIYPSIFLSSFKPVSMLKKTGSTVPGRFSLRRILVVFQFAVSIALIIATSVVYFQMQYIQNKNLGLKMNHVVYFPMTQRLADEVGHLEDALKSNPNILSLTSSRDIPIQIGSNGGGWNWEGMPADQSALVSFTYADYGYPQTFDMNLKAGRFFSKEHPADDSTAVVINESFAKLIGSKSVVGMTLKWGTRPYRVIGVVHDFNFLDLHNKIGPLAILYRRQSANMCVKVNGTEIPATLDFIDRTCKSIDPGFVFDYHFLNKTFERMYVSEQRLGRIVGAFSLLAVIIACLGLVGLASFAAEARTKEVGIRKVLGASVPGVMYLLSKELIGLVLIGNILAWPIAYYFMQKWLQTFAYRIDMSPLIFISAGLAALVIAAATTGFQAIRAATANPIESLHYE